MTRFELSIEDRKFGNFIFPDLEAEMGEVERVAAYIGQDPAQFAEKFLAKARQSSLVELTPSMWSELKNSDSFSVHFGAWDEVAEHAEAHDIPRDWRSYKAKMERGDKVYAPIVIQLPNELHLVSGNTRLMVAKALGKLPTVLLVDLTNPRD